MNSIEKGSRDNWTVTPKRIAALEAAAAAKAARGGGRARRARRRGGGRCGRRRRPARRSDARAASARARSHRALQHRPARPQDARSARLHHSLRPAGFRHRHRVRQRPAQERHHGAEGHLRVHRGRQELPGGFLRGEDRAGVPAARHGHVRAAGPSQRFPLSRRPADSAVRHHRLDAGHPDGREVRPHPRRLRRPVHEGQRTAAAAARASITGPANPGRLPDQPPDQQFVHRWSTGCSRPTPTSTG